MQHSLLADEKAFIGASWGSVKGSEVCLLTTDSRLVEANQEASSWVLGATLSRFSVAAVLMPNQAMIAQRGSKDAAKLVKYEPGSHAETLVAELKGEVSFIRPLPKLNAVLLVSRNGTCECRSVDNLELICDRLEASKDKSDIVSVSLLSLESIALAVLASGLVQVIRISSRDSKVKLERSHLQGGAIESGNILAACVSEIGARLLLTFVQAYQGSTRAITRTFDSASLDLVKNEAYIKFTLPEGVCTVASAPGARLICLNRDEKRVEAWDTYHGLLLDFWQLDSDFECTFISVSSSGRTAVMGGPKQVRLVTIHAEAEAPSLARALMNRHKRSSNILLPVEDQAKSKRKRRGSKHEEEEEASTSDKAYVDIAKIQAAQIKFLEDGNWDGLKTLTSTRFLSEEDLLIRALNAGQTEWCINTLRKCPDVHPAQIAQTVRYVLRLASGEETGQFANQVRKAIEVYGKTLTGAENASAFDRGLASLVYECLRYQHGVQMEMLEVLSDKLSAPEEAAALVACLLFIAEKIATSKREFDQAINAATFVLDAKLIVRLKDGPSRVLAWLKQVTQREVALCEKFDQLGNRIMQLIENAETGKRLPFEVGADYRTEVVRF